MGSLQKLLSQTKSEKSDSPNETKTKGGHLCNMKVFIHKATTLNQNVAHAV